MSPLLPVGFASSLLVFCSRPSSTSPASCAVVFLEFVSLPSFLQLLSLVMNRLSVHVRSIFFVFLLLYSAFISPRRLFSTPPRLLLCSIQLILSSLLHIHISN